MRKTEKQGMKEKVTAINFRDAFPEYDREIVAYRKHADKTAVD